MIQFFAFELVVQLAIISIAISSIAQSFSNDYAYAQSGIEKLSTNIQHDNLIRTFFLFYICFFPAIQAAGLVFVKNTIDPLGNISKLDYLKIISMNQKATSSYNEIK
jgi:hypothetical protein